jgi:hypothetical protein
MAIIRSFTTKFLTALAWVGTLVLAMVDIYFLREIVWAILARFQPGFYSGVLTGQVVTMVGAILFLIYMVISGEYYYRHAGEVRAWTIMGRTYVVLVLIPILAYFM